LINKLYLLVPKTTMKQMDSDNSQDDI